MLWVRKPVHDAAGEIEWRRDHPVGAPPDAEGWYTYCVFLMLSNTVSFKMIQFPGFYVTYDLELYREDVCFALRGGNILGAGYVSNVIHIPAAAIRAALDREGS